MTVVYKSTTSDNYGQGRLKVDYTVTSNGDTATLTVNQTAQYYATTAATIKIAAGDLSVRVPADDFTNRTKNSSAINTAVSTLKTWKDVGTVTKTVTVSQTHSNQTRTIGGACNYTGGKINSGITSLSYLLNGTTGHEAITVTIPPKTTYKVTLDANGGTGGTASLTKWHGEPLSLTSGFTPPTRTGYKFIGWGTSATATTTQAEYTGNTATIFYAVWERQITGITLDVTTLRVADGTSTAEADEGTWCYGTCTYSITGTAAANVTFNVSVTPTDPQIVQSTYTATKNIDDTLTGSFVFRASGCSTDASYTFMVTATANNTSATQTVTKAQGNVLSMAYFVMDVLGNGYTGQRPGHGISFGEPCKSEGFHVGMKPYFGKYPVEDTNDEYALIIGNGTDDNARSNALAVTWDGHIDYGTSGDHYFVFKNTNTSQASVTHWRLAMTGYGNLRLDSSSDGGATWTNGVKYFAAENRTWPVANGGTGATNANDAHKNLGITAGSVSVEATANTYKDVSISFGKTYTSAPTVVVGFYSTSTAAAFGGLTVAVHSITTTGCKARVFNNTSSNRSPDVHWVAVGS